MRTFWFLTIVIVATLLLTACAPAIAGLVAMPEEGRVLIATIVTAGFTWLLVWLSGVIKQDLSGYAAPISAVVSPLLVTVAEKYLNLIPPQYDSFVFLAIHFLVLLVSSLGLFVGLKRVTHKQTRALLQ